MLTRRAGRPPAWDGSCRRSSQPPGSGRRIQRCARPLTGKVQAASPSHDDQQKQQSSLVEFKKSEAYKRLTSGSWRDAYAGQKRASPSPAPAPDQQAPEQQQQQQQGTPLQHQAQSQGASNSQQAGQGSKAASASAPVPKPARFYGGNASPPAAAPQQTVQRVSTATGGAIGPRPRFGGGLARPMTRVRFWLNWHVNYGQSIHVVGSHDNLGSWQLGSSLVLQWSEGDQWTAAVDLPAGRIQEYKYVLVDSSTRQALSWQQGNNSVLALRQDDREVEVYDNWAGGPGAAVIASGQTSTREGRLVAWAEDIEQLVTSQRGELRRSRMELIAAQNDARDAREETRRVKAELAFAEAERQKNQTRVRELEGMNRMLRTQLHDSAASFRAAIEAAQRYMQEAENPSGVDDSRPGPVPTKAFTPAAPAADVDALGSHSEAAEGGVAPLASHSSPLDDSPLADELQPLESDSAVAAPEPVANGQANGVAPAAGSGSGTDADEHAERLFREAVQQSGRGNSAVNAAVPHKPGAFVEAQGTKRSSKPQQAKTKR